MDDLERRAWLIEHMDLLLSEAIFHRTNDEAEKLPYAVIWREGEDVASE